MSQSTIDELMNDKKKRSVTEVMELTGLSRVAVCRAFKQMHKYGEMKYDKIKVGRVWSLVWRKGGFPFYVTALIFILLFVIMKMIFG